MDTAKNRPELPEEFLNRMQNMLGGDYAAFLAGYGKPRTFGLRLNTHKITAEEFERIVPFPVERIPWVKNGYLYTEETHPSRCPYYQAGLYYLQEPSAMTPASRLPVEPGDFVLDLCAAPGGKATALGAELRGCGLLVANDISASRARALLRNLELFGIPNLFVANEKPERLAAAFPGFFHKIMLDAPCSGEGMFRKEEALARDWSPEKSAQLADTQRGLILLAADMLRPGGLLMYSTCTFAPQEDEEVIAFLLANRPDMEILDVPSYSGFSSGVPGWGDGTEQLKKCVRIFPHKMNGEGHFFALLKKAGSAPDTHYPPGSRIDRTVRKWMEGFFSEIGMTSLGGHPFDWNRVDIRGGKAYYLPPDLPDFRGLTFLRNGLYLGDLKKDRFEPAQPLALAFKKGEVSSAISLPVSDERLQRYLKGESISVHPQESSCPKGWHLLCADGYPLGFGKLVNGTLKNKYPAGWRTA